MSSIVAKVRLEVRVVRDNNDGDEDKGSKMKVKGDPDSDGDIV